MTKPDNIEPLNIISKNHGYSKKRKDDDDNQGNQGKQRGAVRFKFTGRLSGLGIKSKQEQNRNKQPRLCVIL